MAKYFRYFIKYKTKDSLSLDEWYLSIDEWYLEFFEIYACVSMHELLWNSFDNQILIDNLLTAFFLVANYL